MNQWVRWVVLCWLGMAGSVAAAERVALVIGNAAYQVGRLANPVNDAEDMSAALQALNFQVELVKNGDRADILRAVDRFSARIQPNGLALVFYSGHGVEVDGKNYLLPVDNHGIRAREDVPIHAVELNAILNKIESAGARLNMVILDACRDDPLPSTAKSMSKGLQVVTTGRATLLAYATSPGSTAADGTARNSPYTEALKTVLREPGLSVIDLFQKVGSMVMAETGNRQIPWNSNTPIWPPIYLAGAPDGSTPPPAPIPVAAPAPVLPTPAAPSTPGPGGLIDLGDGRLQDTRTQLIWTQSDNGVNYNWEEAKSWCEGQGMRLPSLDQLETIYLRTTGERVACGDFRCSISPMFKLSSYRLWSSNRSGRNAQSFYFNDGAKLADPVDNDTDGRVLCVTQ